jgi:hypothetical protein
MRIKKRQNGCIIELDDGSAWRIWPGDVERTKKWTHSTKLTIYKFNGDFCTHVLFDRLQGICVRAIDAAEHWPSEAMPPQRDHAPIAA